MRLYHFTAKHLGRSIKKSGHIYGVMPISLAPPLYEHGFVWLTVNSSFEQQCLKGTGRLPYERNEVRLTIEIPLDRLGRLLKFDQNKDLTPLYDELTKLGDPENWYVFKGVIPSGWIRKIENNPRNSGEGEL